MDALDAFWHRKLLEPGVTELWMPMKNFDTHCACCSTALQCSGNTRHLCSRCRVARYCGKSCQRAHWQAHRLQCDAMVQHNTAAMCKYLVNGSITDGVLDAHASGVQYAPDTPCGLQTFSSYPGADGPQWQCVKFESAVSQSGLQSMGARPLPRKFWTWLCANPGKQGFLRMLRDLYQQGLPSGVREAYRFAMETDCPTNLWKAVGEAFVFSSLSDAKRQAIERLAETQGLTCVYATQKKSHGRAQVVYSKGHPKQALGKIIHLVLLGRESLEEVVHSRSSGSAAQPVSITRSTSERASFVITLSSARQVSKNKCS